MSNQNQDLQPRWSPHAAVAGWLVPGLGHFILGQRQRGVILCVAIVSLWSAGLLIGGISVIDRYDRVEPSDDGHPEPPSRSWWFYGQAMIAPSFAVDYFRDRLVQSRLKEMGYGDADYGSRHPVRANPRRILEPARNPGDVEPPYEPSFGKVAEQGTLFTALAGMLNLLAMIDALYYDPRRRGAAAAQPQAAGAIA